MLTLAVGLNLLYQFIEAFKTLITPCLFLPTRLCVLGVWVLPLIGPISSKCLPCMPRLPTSSFPKTARAMPHH